MTTDNELLEEHDIKVFCKNVINGKWVRVNAETLTFLLQKTKEGDKVAGNIEVKIVKGRGRK